MSKNFDELDETFNVEADIVETPEKKLEKINQLLTISKKIMIIQEVICTPLLKKVKKHSMVLLN